MEAKLIKNGNAYSLKINGEYVAFANEDFVGYATQEFRDNLLGKLSLKNCQAIELDYDLDELARKIRGLMMISGTSNGTIDHPNTDKMISLFQKALSILGDKKFSEEDMRKFGEICYYAIDTGDDVNKLFNEYQSLQQTEFSVEVEMVYIINKKRNVGPSVIIDYKETQPIPKLDADGCLILRKI